MRSAWIAVLAVACSSGSPAERKQREAGGPPSPYFPVDADFGSGQVRDAILAVTGHVVVMKTDAAFTDYRSVLETARASDPGVIAAAPFLWAELVAEANGWRAPITVKGVGDDALLRRNLERYIVERSEDPAIASEPVPLLIAENLARRLHVGVGDRVRLQLSATDASLMFSSADAAPPPVVDGRVTAIMRYWVPDYDDRMVLTTLAAVQRLVGRGDDQVLGIELRLTNPNDAPAVKRKLADKLGTPPYHVTDWCELNKQIFPTCPG